MKIKTILLLTGVLSVLQVNASDFPITIDSCGKQLTFTRAPQRAVIHDLNMAEMAFALHLQPYIVGVTGITGWYKSTAEFNQARGNIPELAPKYPSLEALLAVQADFFFAGWNYGMKVGGEVTPESLAKFQIKTLELTESCIHIDKHRPRASMDLLYTDIAKLGKIFGKSAAANQLINDWKSSLHSLKQIIGQRQPLRVFVYDSGQDKPFTSGAYAMPTAIIEAAGGKNIMDTLPTSWTTTSWESVATAEPDLIILLDYQNGSQSSADSAQHFLETHPLMKQTPAVIHHRYLRLKYQQLTPGPANVDAAWRLAHALYPAAFH